MNHHIDLFSHAIRSQYQMMMVVPTKALENDDDDDDDCE